MGNPARVLHSIFQAWLESEGTARIRRDLESADAEGHQLHWTAIRALFDIDQALKALESQGVRVAAYRDAQYDWLKAFLHFPYNWDGHTTDMTINRFSMSTLDNLASLLDLHAPRLNEDRVQDLQQLFKDIIAELGNHPNINPELKTHILRTIQVARDAFEQYQVGGESDIATALYNLWVSLYAAEGATKSGGKFTAFAERIIYPSAAGILSGAAVNLLALPPFGS